jgi:hypothetical protein
MIMATTVPKISLADLIAGVKGINGTNSTTTTTNTAFNQQALDQLMRSLLASNPQYSKDNALADATGITQRVTKAIQGQQPQLLSAQMGAGLQSSTTGSLLQNDLVNQILMAEGSLQQQQIKDYASIQNQQAQEAAYLAQAGNRTTTVQDPGVGLQGLIAPLALSMGGQYAYNKLFGDAPEVGKQLASTVGGNANFMQGIPATNTGGTMLGNTLISPSATIYPNQGVQVVERGAPVTDYSGIINTGSSQANGLTETTMSTRPAVSAWDTEANGATGDLSATASASADSSTTLASTASDAGFDASPGFGNVGGGVFAAADTFMHGGSIGEAGMEGAKAYLAMSNPYTAAAYLIDKATGGVISHGITQVSDFLGTKKPVDEIWQGTSDFFSNPTNGKAFDEVWQGTQDLFSAPFKKAGSVICTALAHHGLASAEELKASNEYRSKFISMRSYLYYLQWATPHANIMTLVRPGYWTGKQRVIAWGAKQYIKYVTGTASLGTKALVRTGIYLHELLAKVFYKPEEVAV